MVTVYLSLLRDGLGGVPDNVGMFVSKFSSDAFCMLCFLMAYTYYSDSCISFDHIILYAPHYKGKGKGAYSSS